MNIKRSLSLALIPVLFINLFLLQPVHAAEDAYSPDNSNKTDPMQTSKQMRGNFQVGEFTGASIYDYPIALPAGRNGMTPAVQLTYNSQDSSHDNIVGYRWSLNTYSIKRLNKKGVENLYNRNDFAIYSPAGSGELVATQLTDGAHGQYGQKVESSFAKYEFLNDNTWLITDKQGAQYKFGLTDESRQFDPDDPSRIYQWMLEEIRDRNDNFIRYTYFKLDNSIYPKTIHYTGHGTEDGVFEVRFLPFANNETGDARPDPYFGYEKGFRTDTKYLVTGIEIYAEENLRREYKLQHTNIDPIVKQTIQQIQEIGYSNDGQVTSLPPTRFEYTPSDVRWEETTDYMPTWTFEHCYHECGGAYKIYEWDMNGNGIHDFEFSDSSSSSSSRKRAVSDLNGGWKYEDATYPDPGYYPSNGIPNIPKKAIDFNGDVRADIIRSYIGLNSSRTSSQYYSSINLFNGSNYQDTIKVAMGAYGPGKPDNGASLADLNGDGLTDIIQSRYAYWGGNQPPYGEVQEKTCLNNQGQACSLTSLWEAPEVIITDGQYDQRLGRQSYVQDCNYDGLADFYYRGNGYTSPAVWINDGKGGWIKNPPNSSCAFNRKETNTHRSFDANGDGMIDFIDSYRIYNNAGYRDTNDLYLNKGSGSEVYKYKFPIMLGTINGSYHGDSGVRIVDLNGDLLPDVIQSLERDIQEYTNVNKYFTKKVFINKGSRPYFLKTIHTSQGGRVDLEHKTSAQYLKEDGTQANPNLPIITTTVSKITTHDGMGHLSSVDYFYEDGHYHYNSVDDREMAGFRVVTKTDELGFVTKAYYHQGENSVADTGNGEYDDHISKKGAVYRSEIYDDQNRLVAATINRYQKNNLGSNRYYPFLDRTVSVNYNPVGGSNRSTAQYFEYDSYGNPILTIDYGEVQLNGNDGAFGDIENDLIRQENTFTQNTTDHLLSFPVEQKVFDHTNQLIGHNRTYYDNLDFGSVTIGNPTRMETWLNTTNNFIASTVEYNEFGMPIRQVNPRGYTSTVTYDSLNLHPVSQTNPLGHMVVTDYDVATGQLLQSTDSNNAVTKNTFDGMGRLTKTEISHPTSGSLINSKSVSYSDSGAPRTVQSTIHNDDGIQVNSYSYLDGLGRVIETKTESSNGKWSTSATIFDKRGNVKKSIQPYFSGSTAFESINENRIGTSFTYDVLGRGLAAVNPLGTTSTQYDIWNKTLTDPNGKIKDFKFDARGQLMEVGEHLGANINRTKYSYDSIGNLVKIADALNNIRDFTYDNFGRRLTQTDAHAVGQSYGTWQYSYDENSNLIQRTNPLNQAVQYAYDELDRMTAEDFLGEGGTEFTFLYDQGTNAIGRLSTVTSSNYQHNYEYDLLGRVLRDQKQIDGRDFTFTYDYDLMGGVTRMMYPDDMEIFYSYDNAHQLSKVYSENKIFADQFDTTPLGQLAAMRIGEQMVTTNIYESNEMYRLTQKQTLQHGVVRLQDFQYDYDSMGNLMKLVDQSNAITSKDVDYLYDDLYRLTEARYTNTGNYEFTTMNYQYNAIGNMVFKSDIGLMEYRHHNPHAVTKAGDSSYSYDLNGSMADHNGNTLTYDYRGRMIQSGDGTNYFYDESNQRLKKGDKYYPNKYYEIDGSKEVKYVFAGNTKIAKVVRALIEPPIVEPIEGQTEGQIEDPSIIFNGTKESGLAMWVNGIEILPAGPETEWEYSTDLIVGDNVFEFYTKKDVETASKRITQSITYEVPTPVIEPIENPTTSTRILLNGTKRANTSIWINGEEVVPINDQTVWNYEIALLIEQNTFEIHAEDRLSQEGDSLQLNLTYFAQAPTVDDFEQPVKTNPFTIRGEKALYMSIWVNGEEVVPMDEKTTWQTSLKLEKGINSFIVFSKNEFGVESNGVILTMPYDVNAPTLDPIQSPTSDAIVSIMGTKPAYSSLWINDEEVIPMDSNEFWVHNVRLTDVTNTFRIYTKDEEGVESATMVISIDYDATPPVVDMSASNTSNGSYALSGAKSAGTAIWVNGKELVPADETTVWAAYFQLNPGANTLEIITRSSFGIESDSVNLEVNYIPSAQTDPSIFSSSSGSGGGGYRTPISTQLFEARMEEVKMQNEIIESEKKAEEDKGEEKDLSDPEVIADYIIRSQSGDRSNTPKSVWPTAESKTGVEFKNLQITYQKRKAIIKWDKMSKEVAEFRVYRSKYAYPDRRSKHASRKIATIKASSFKNRYTDKNIEDDKHYTYRVVALDHNGDIIKTSIQLNSEQVFVAQKSGDKINFERYTDKTFDKVYITQHNHLDFEKTSDPKKVRVEPKDGFRLGTKIHVRFINCEAKENGKPYCQNVDQKILDVYTIKKPGIPRLSFMTNQI